MKGNHSSRLPDHSLPKKKKTLYLSRWFPFSSINIVHDLTSLVKLIAPEVFENVILIIS